LYFIFVSLWFTPISTPIFDKFIGLPWSTGVGFM